MALRIEDYALIGDCHTAALVGIDGSIDWLCLPRFDSPSSFAALLGTPEHGRWLVAPSAPGATATRSYLGNTFLLSTRWQTPDGEVEVVDTMLPESPYRTVVRRIRGISGRVRMRQELAIRFGYADALPWLRQAPEHGGNAIVAVAGPDAVIVRGPALTATDHVHESSFEVAEGEVVDIQLSWFRSHLSPPHPVDVDAALESTAAWWTEWADASDLPDPYSGIVRRSLLVLRALTHEETGGIVAAATTSLPEQFGGPRNWDYRYTWIRDASLTLSALMLHGYEEETGHWRRWLLRAIAGDPADIQTMYGLGGERRLTEYVVDSLPGYTEPPSTADAAHPPVAAAPVRVGNGASEQYQGDIFGELMIALREARRIGVDEDEYSWPLQRALLGFLAENWQRPDNGIWEIRGPQVAFTHSRAMIWAAFSCGVEAVREYGLAGDADLWAGIRDTLRTEIETQGYDPVRNTFVQHYGSTEVDASLLLLSQIGFVAADDPRMLGTVKAIEEDLLHEGLLLRYRTQSGVDGLPGGEHPFLACSFWLVGQYARSGRLADATALMDRLVGLANDVGLLAEEYDVQGSRQVGNTPQAFSHLALVRAADAIAQASGSQASGALASGTDARRAARKV
ncbi:glycoside hydrolase family 15 protein [Herbiconiux sp. CPCC 203407]|uniref:Glycoside hydrolase family 15 protein n=1 Tax=Herbiconiux oxytropis TaxID=2970915 RepID=A0AA42BU70_9MICO|nr:glycoside hydrolase family 15 protein [Herbiconiux oxytropis]MCS5723886.1 glycoside hydrolase family 15 protein [Herbiconiux oxytropis]MCS5725916.1 glycoside hydrolase family 15 protein [Herbiconiux oxytropis]